MISILLWGLMGYGTPIQVMSSYYAVYYFRVCVNKSGASDVFIKLALAIAGHRQVAGKVAVLSSTYGYSFWKCCCQRGYDRYFYYPLMKKAKIHLCLQGL